MKTELQKTAVALSIAFGLLNGVETTQAQNVGVNTTGASPAATNLFEVLQPSTTANTVGIYSEHSGVVGSGTAYGLQAISNGAGINNVAAYLQAINGTSSNYALIVPSGGGNVGIGHSTPNGTLHIASASSGVGSFNGNANELILEGSANTGMQIHSPDANYGRILFGSPSDDIGAVIDYSYNGGNPLLNIATTNANGELSLSSSGNNEAMRINSLGNVGIGTTAPSTKLDAMGNIFLFGSDNVSQTTRTNATVKNTYFAVPHYTNAEERMFLMAGQSTATTNDIYIGNSFTGTANTATSIRFATAANNTTVTGTERMRIDNNGNIGIGTISPDYNIDLQATFPTLALRVETEAVNNRGELFFAIGTGSNANTEVIGSIRGIITQATPSALKGAMEFRVNTGDNTNPFMYAKDDGNVGIGTITPTSKLVVTENNESTTLTDFTQNITKAGLQISTKYTVGAYTPGIFWQTSNENSTKPKAGIWLFENGSGTKMYFGTSNTYGTGITNNGLVLDQSGNVGVGTTVPDRLFDVHGDMEVGNGGKLYIKTAGGTQNIILNNGNGSVGAGSDILFNASGMISAEDQIYFTIDSDNGSTTSFYDFAKDAETSAGTSLMRIQEDGNVGIGTTSPTARLQIGDGTVNTSNKIVFGKFEAASQSNLPVIQQKSVASAGASNDLALGATSTSGAILFYTGNNTTLGSGSNALRMIVDNVGNVGINCASPNQQLYVGGNIYATGTVLGSQAACSDKRWKKDFEPLIGSLEAIRSLQGLYYNWKKDEFPEKDFSSRREIGLIAQEVEKIYPELIFTDEQGYKYLDYSHLTPVLIEAIKEQQILIDDLKKENNTIKSQNSVLLKNDETLKAEIEEIKAMLNQQTKK